MKNKNKLAPSGRVNSAFIIGTAIILLFASAVTSILEAMFIKINISAIFSDGAWYRFLIFSSTSTVLGLGLALILGKIIFKPLNTIAKGMEDLANGDFTTRIDLGKYDGIKPLTNSFNLLAQELQKTEILRSDFINDFSHEIKTPIVSISGLITLLKSNDLSEEKRQQYLQVMEEETNRLTQMTSNALYLSKIESQGILTNKTTFNLSEQIRDSVLLLERKWSKKNLSPNLDFDEYTILANEDMLKQVWVNLLDNAVKFAEVDSEFDIFVTRSNGQLLVSITNFGPEIPESERKAIFEKFYQCDKSRSSDGNGIGLSIVKHIISLHNGDISVNCSDGKTTFKVTLPQNLSEAI